MEHHRAHTILPSLRTDLPVLLIKDLDHNWPQEEISQTIEMYKFMTEAMRAAGHPLISIKLEDNNISSFLDGYDPAKLIVFNWCEEVPGTPHSSWMMAHELEKRGFTFTGADSHALVLSQDKRLVLQRLKDAGIPTPIWQIFYSASSVDWDLFPAIVKPAFEHYSWGIDRESVVQSKAELISRVRYVIETLKQPVIVEEFIDGRELHVGVVGNGKLQMLPPAEIDYSAFTDIHDHLCTYEANFDQNSQAYQRIEVKLPINFTPQEMRELERVVLGAYRATDCRDYARMDVRIRDDIFYTLDVNHNADIGPDTSLAMAVEMIGYPYGQFGSLLVTLAAARHPVFGNGAHIPLAPQLLTVSG